MDLRGGSGSGGRQWIRGEAVDPREAANPEGGSGSGAGEAVDLRKSSGSKGRHTHLHLALRNFF